MLDFGSSRARWVLVATSLGSGMAFLDSTVVNVALPHLGRSLGSDVAGLQWTVNAYLLTLASLILLGGALGDRLGRRRVFVAGVVWFTLASLLCGLAQSLEQLVAARALQGVGGALMTPGSLAILQSGFRPQDRARAIALWSGLTGVASAAGPFVGGWLVDQAGWRWVFLVNLPIGAAVVLIALRHVPETRDPQAVRRVDASGAGLSALALGGVTYALIAAADRGTTSPEVLVGAVVGAAAGAGFLLHERMTPAPMLPLGLFGSRLFTVTNLVTFLVYGGLGGVFLFLVLMLQVVAGFSALAAGVALLPVTVLMLLLSPRVGTVAVRTGPRLPMTLGPAIAAASVVVMADFDASTSYVAQVLPVTSLFGLGLAVTVAPLTATVLAAAPDRHAGMASAVNNAVARTAGLLAVAALPLVSGLDGTSYRDAALLLPAYRVSMLSCAALIAAGAVLALLWVRRPAGTTSAAVAA